MAALGLRDANAALFGVAVLNGLVLISFAEQLERAGKPPAQAIREAAELRLARC